MSHHTGQHKFYWEEYLQLSEKLMLQSGEYNWRCSGSRAYYAVFCLARNKAGFEKEKKNVHFKVISHYKRSKDANKENIGLLLDELRKFRVKCDYREHADITWARADDKVKKARTCLNSVSVLPERDY